MRKVKFKRSLSNASVSSYSKKYLLFGKNWHVKNISICASSEKVLTKWLEDCPLNERSNPRVVFVKKQTKGYGQYGRYWYSPSGGIWLSAAIPIAIGAESASLFGLSVAYNFCLELENIGITAKIKWPNDILVNDKKLAGFLPRLILRSNKLRYLRIGIGLNTNNDTPKSGISLKKLLDKNDISLSIWASKVILILNKSILLLDSNQPFYYHADKFLWSTRIIDSSSGIHSEIIGFQKDGSLKVCKNKTIISLRRW